MSEENPEAQSLRTAVPEETKYIYYFDEGSISQKPLLGGKGASLAEMTRIDLPVPPGFTLTTEACMQYTEQGESFLQGLEESVQQYLSRVEDEMQRRFGDAHNPLLVSVRSGAAISMPGMMDTILNLGLNDETVGGLAAETGDERFAYDCYRRFIQMFGNVGLGIDIERFEANIEQIKAERGVEFETELTADDFKSIVEAHKATFEEVTGRPFPQDPNEQLFLAIKAVFDSWDNERARVYRRHNDIPDDLGTAVNVQTMVFGNMGEDSGTGVVFTRNPSTGEKALYGEYLSNAQGEDVVAGIRTPLEISDLKQRNPEIYEQLQAICEQLESHYRDVQDIEFTIQQGELYLLQTRTGKRTAQAAVKIAHDMVKEGIIDRQEALLRVEPEQISRLLHRNIDGSQAGSPAAEGLPASPGAAVGQVVFTADEAQRLGEQDEKVILVRPMTTPEDFHGVVGAQGILTSRGGMTCHAAIVARGMGKPCVCGCDALEIDLTAETVRINGTVVNQGDWLSIDGGTGQVFIGKTPTIDPDMTDEFGTLLDWADEFRQLEVWANADTAEDAGQAVWYGAEGIGLCRTEHMFMQPERTPVVQRMILADSAEQRDQALAELLPMQRDDFAGIFRAMEGRPVTVRLLDPPLHEFLPDLEQLVAKEARLEATGGEPEELEKTRQLLNQVRQLHEDNPMLGHRGCRLGIIYPEIYDMQVQALFEAAAEVKQDGITVQPEVMIPLVSHQHELQILRERVEATAQRVLDTAGTGIDYEVGTMIEVPRACVTAGAIAETAEFFSFGTNDLTQTTFGFSRDDAEAKFLTQYLQDDVIPENPFAVLDQAGVGQLMRMAVEQGRAARADLKVGICGEHGGDAQSIAFCQTIGLDYVSCSPYRVPVARLAAAHAVLNKDASSEA